MSIRVTSDEAMLAYTFFGELSSPDPFTFPLVPLNELNQDTTISEVYNATVVSTDEAPAKTPDLAIQKSNTLVKAKKFYKEALAVDSPATKVKKIASALRQIEKGLLMGSTTSMTHYGLIGMKARIHLDISENKETITRDHMPVNEIESMVKTANAALTEQAVISGARAKGKVAEFAGLIQRISDIQDRAIAPISVKKALAKIKKQYDDVTFMIIDTQKKSKAYQNIMKSVDEALQRQDLEISDKGALVLKKAQIRMRSGGDREEIRKMINAMLDESAAASAKRVQWQSVIYPLNELLLSIDE